MQTQSDRNHVYFHFVCQKGADPVRHYCLNPHEQTPTLHLRKRQIFSQGLSDDLLQKALIFGGSELHIAERHSFLYKLFIPQWLGSITINLVWQCSDNEMISLENLC